MAAVPAHHASAARSDDVLLADRPDHLVDHGVRPDLHHDERRSSRARRSDHDGHVLHLHGGVPLLQDGLRRGPGMDPVPPVVRGLVLAVPVVSEAGRTSMSTVAGGTQVEVEKGIPVPTLRPPARRRRARPATALKYISLTALAVLFVAPFVYMVTASLLPLREIFSYPPKWIPLNP